MIGPEVRKEFERWARNHLSTESRWLNGAYPLWANGHWYMRERMPGSRVWRLEESEEEFSFVEVRDPKSVAVS